MQKKGDEAMELTPRKLQRVNRQGRIIEAEIGTLIILSLTTDGRAWQTPASQLPEFEVLAPTECGKD